MSIYTVDSTAIGGTYAHDFRQHERNGFQRRTNQHPRRVLNPRTNQQPRRKRRGINPSARISNAVLDVNENIESVS